MPTVTEQPITGYAHCVNPRCRGYQQEEVAALREETAFTYAENGGDLPGIERSHVHFRFANAGQDGGADDTRCQHCGGHRDLSETRRRQYANLTGYDQMGLLRFEGFDPAKQAGLSSSAPSNQEREEFEQQKAAFIAEMADMRAQMAELAEARTAPEES